MDRARATTWVERLIWVFVFAGLAGLVLGLATLDLDAATAWVLIAVGGLAAAAGVVLIWVRSRLEGVRP